MLLLKKIRRNLTDYGLWLTLKKAFEYLIKPIYEKWTYIVFFIHLDQVRYRSFDHDIFSYKFITKDDDNIIAQIEDKEEWLHNKLKNKLRSNCICLTTYYNDKLAGFFIVNINEFTIPLIQYKKALRSDESYVDQITADKIHRGTELTSLMRYKMFNELKRRNIKRLYAATLLSNIAARKSAQKFGYKYIADLSYFKFLYYKDLRFKRARINIY